MPVSSEKFDKYIIAFLIDISKCPTISECHISQDIGCFFKEDIGKYLTIIHFETPCICELSLPTQLQATALPKTAQKSSRCWCVTILGIRLWPRWSNVSYLTKAKAGQGCFEHFPSLQCLVNFASKHMAGKNCVR